MFKLMDKKIITILRSNFLLNWPYGTLFPEILDPPLMVVGSLLLLLLLELKWYKIVFPKDFIFCIIQILYKPNISILFVEHLASQ